MPEPLIEQSLLAYAVAHFVDSDEPIALAEWGNRYGHGPGAAMQAANWLANRGLVIVNSGSPGSLLCRSRLDPWITEP